MTYQAVRFILRCPTYISRAWPKRDDSRRGKLSEPLSTESGRWPALVDEATWHRAQELVERHQSIPRQASGRHLLTGFLRCPRCGSRMIGVELPQGKRPAGSEASYQCRGVHNLGAAAPDPTCRYRAAKQPVDAALLDRLCAVVGVVTTGDARQQPALRAAWRQLRDEVPASAIGAQIAQLEREAERYRYRLTEGARLLVDGVLDRAGYERLRDAQEANLKATDAEIARLRDSQPKEALPPLDEVVASAASWAEILRGRGVPAQREVLALLVRRVVPIEQGGGQYDVEVTWTPLGSSLARLAGSR